MTEVVLQSELKEKDGFIYLEIPECIVKAFVQMIPHSQVVEPKYAVKENYVGPHISVITSDEHAKIRKRKTKNKVIEVGEQLNYTIDRLYRTKPKNWDDVKEVFFIVVNSPDLEYLRSRYKLKKRISDNQFHITVGVVKA